MIRQILTIFIIILAICDLAKGQVADSSNILNDVVVQETYEAHFEEDKSPIQIDLDFSNVVKISERMNWKSIDMKREPIEQSSSKIMKLQLSSPEFARIRPAPVKIFKAHLEKLDRWQLDITSSNGSLFRSMTGKGTPPEKITWDGKSNTGDPLVPGHTYAYSFMAVNKAGNKKTFPGKSFSVPAFYMQQADTLLIGLAASILFTSDGFGLTPAAEQFAHEVASLIRYFSKHGKFSIAGHNRIMDKFLNLIAKDLVVEESIFQHINTGQSNVNCLMFYIE